ncbi:DNA recombination and repair protein RecO [Methylophaga frappieri]|uniref:DNA repair protein RecO n=1 Tax=Methylophaga frappieri (strain ATCC BAA-2434 / DSM 25690 / JAM7) TaxID=754477 RepID=I1YF98_METFJ|nr:DNA repair protein RecO [Methylophaga frappieri]AFJ01591.1 DNA recombination and repair protein RecO [Methylophaga frappieri]
MDLSPAYILHQRAYRETSLLLDVFSLQAGRLSLVAKGVRQQKRRTQTSLQLFQPIWLSWFGRGELQTLAKSESMQPAFRLTGDASFYGLYVNELLIYLLRPGHPEPEIFQLYEHTLQALALGEQLENSLRQFESQLLTILGYGVDLHYDTDGQPVEATNLYYLNAQQTLQRLPEPQAGMRTLQGQSLIQLREQQQLDVRGLSDCKWLMRTVLNYVLDGKPLKSRQLFVQMQQYQRNNRNQEGDT